MMPHEIERTEMERRILLAFALNEVRAMTCAELMVSAAVCRRPVDETPTFEAAIRGLAERGAAILFRHPVLGWQMPGVRVAEGTRLPVLTATAIRRRMGVRRREEDGLRRLLAVPGPPF